MARSIGANKWSTRYNWHGIKKCIKIKKNCRIHLHHTSLNAFIFFRSSVDLSLVPKAWGWTDPLFAIMTGQTCYLFVKLGIDPTMNYSLYCTLISITILCHDFDTPTTDHPIDVGTRLVWTVLRPTGDTMQILRHNLLWISGTQIMRDNAERSFCKWNQRKVNIIPYFSIWMKFRQLFQLHSWNQSLIKVIEI